MTEKGGKNINSESFVVLALLIIASIPLIVFHTMFYKNEPEFILVERSIP